MTDSSSTTTPTVPTQPGYLAAVARQLDEDGIAFDPGDLYRWLASVWQRRFAEAEDSGPDRLAREYAAAVRGGKVDCH